MFRQNKTREVSESWLVKFSQLFTFVCAILVEVFVDNVIFPYTIAENIFFALHYIGYENRGDLYAYILSCRDFTITITITNIIIIITITVSLISLLLLLLPLLLLYHSIITHTILSYILHLHNTYFIMP